MLLCSDQINEISQITPIFPEMQGYQADLAELRKQQKLLLKMRFKTLESQSSQKDDLTF